MYERQMQSSCSTSSCNEIDYAKRLAHWANVELLKEKLKQRMETQNGKKLDTLADLIADVVIEKQKNVEDLEKKQEELEKALEDLGAS